MTDSPLEPTSKTSPEPTPKRNSSLKVVAAIAAAALVGGVSGAGVTAIALSQDDKSGALAAAPPTSITVNDPDNATNVTAVAAKAAASVVTIDVSSSSAGGTGSGVVLTKDGYVLTNTHVVTLEGAVSNPTIKVETSNGKLFDATIVGTDAISDLAVIKVKGVTDLVPAEFADSSKLNVGDGAIAIGAPLGLTGTVTDGIISALNRSITVASSAVPDNSNSDGGDQNGENPFNFWQFEGPGGTTTPQASSATISLAVIQTDAAINPGNSGGALLNTDGKVIGINCAIASAGSSSSQGGSIGVGFAIPANLAQRVAQELMKDGKATHGLLGASITDTSNETALVVGASVASVVNGSAADAAGIKKGDVITAFNGVQITGATDLTAQVRYLPAGATAQLTYERDGKATTVSVKLGALA
jgi:putative serine protease PepD